MIQKIIREHYLIIIFLLFYFFITLYKFVAYPTPFYDWDESIYAQVGKEMVEKKSLVPLWQGQYWLDKPPLTPLMYGLVESITPLPAELSTRLLTLLLGIVILSLTYIFYWRITKNKFISTLTVIITAFTPIFLQRTQVLNVDVFLFLGWIGYLVFYTNYWLSLSFLGIGVLSKSLLGFYPVIGLFILFSLQLFFNKIKKTEYKKLVIFLFTQFLILLVWYFVMIVYFKKPFIQAHFLDSHLKRVIASIESHFGKHTYYFDVLSEQLGFFIYLSILGLILYIGEFVKKKHLTSLIFNLFFLPWFLFLNLTKTKIAWYLYPVIPQFAYLSSYFFQVIKKNNLLSYLFLFAISGFIIYTNVIKGPFFSTQYSSFDENYQLAIRAKSICQDLTILVDKDSRIAHNTLQKMNLLIGTSDWWGNHPAIVYYSQKKVNFIYDVTHYYKLLKNAYPKQCFVNNKNDSDLPTIPDRIILDHEFINLQLLINKL